VVFIFEFAIKKKRKYLETHDLSNKFIIYIFISAKLITLLKNFITIFKRVIKIFNGKFYEPF